MRNALSAALGAALLATACTPVPPPAEAQACSPLAWASLVGTPVAALSLPAGLEHRIYRRGDMVTADYIENRLNIVTDAGGTIVEVSCG